MLRQHEQTAHSFCLCMRMLRVRPRRSGAVSASAGSGRVLLAQRRSPQDRSATWRERIEAGAARPARAPGLLAASARAHPACAGA
eukprot:6205538-Pleurochrysis_carterae.AAC.4